MEARCAPPFLVPAAVLPLLPARCALRFVVALFRRHAGRGGGGRALSARAVGALLRRAGVLRRAGAPGAQAARWRVAAGAAGELTLPHWLAFWGALAATAPLTACAALTTLGYDAGGAPPLAAPPRAAPPSQPPPRTVRVLLLGAQGAGKSRLAQAVLQLCAAGHYEEAGAAGDAASTPPPPPPPPPPPMVRESDDGASGGEGDDGASGGEGDSAGEDEFAPVGAQLPAAAAQQHTAVPVPTRAGAPHAPWTLVLSEVGGAVAAAARTACAPGVDGVLLVADADCARSVAYLCAVADKLPPGTPAAVVVARGGGRRYQDFLAAVCGGDAASAAADAAAPVPLCDALRAAWDALLTEEREQEEEGAAGGWQAASLLLAGEDACLRPPKPPPPPPRAPLAAHRLCVPLVDAAAAGGAAAAVLEAALALAAEGGVRGAVRSAAQRAAERDAATRRARLRGAVALAVAAVVAGVVFSVSKPAREGAARGAVAAWGALARLPAALRRAARGARAAL
jgi:hypothetical protein